MKTIFSYSARLAIVAAILFTALSPNGGVLYHNGLSCVALGLIGFGLIVERRRRGDAKVCR